MIGVAILASASFLPGDIDYQKVADAATWSWSGRDSNPLHSALVYQGDYQVEIVIPEGRSGLTIRLTDGPKEVYSWAGHEHSVFVQGGDVLYYAAFHHSSSGCTVVAYDLKARKERWRARLKGLGGIPHSAYHNEVALDVNEDVVTVHGNESRGRYLEFVDIRTGKTVGHKVFEAK